MAKKFSQFVTEAGNVSSRVAAGDVRQISELGGTVRIPAPQAGTGGGRRAGGGDHPVLRHAHQGIRPLAAAARSVCHELGMGFYGGHYDSRGGSYWIVAKTFDEAVKKVIKYWKDMYSGKDGIDTWEQDSVTK
jgi:hypothetical protein